MARRFAALLVSLATALSAQAQSPPPPGPPDDPGLPRRFQDGERRPHRDKDGDGDRDRDRDHGKDGDRPDWLKKKLERMGPEERKRILENYEKWKKLPPEEREKLRKKGDRQRGEFIRAAVADALQRSGLKLSAEEQEAYAVRYREERRKMEEKLREELDRKRQELLPQMEEKLKEEFSPRNQSQPTAVPTTPPASTGGSGS